MLRRRSKMMRRPRSRQRTWCMTWWWIAPQPAARTLRQHRTTEELQQETGRRSRREVGCASSQSSSVARMRRGRRASGGGLLLLEVRNRAYRKPRTRAKLAKPKGESSEVPGLQECQPLVLARFTIVLTLQITHTQSVRHNFQIDSLQDDIFVTCMLGSFSDAVRVRRATVRGAVGSSPRVPNGIASSLEPQATAKHQDSRAAGTRAPRAQ